MFSVGLLVFMLYEKFIISTILYQVLIISFLLIIILKGFNQNMNVSTDRNNSMLFRVYLSCFFFGIYHLSNFKHINTLDIIIISYVLSKILAGFIFTLLRVKFGIIASIALHVFLNSFSYILIYGF